MSSWAKFPPEFLRLVWVSLGFFQNWDMCCTVWSRTLSVHNSLRWVALQIWYPFFSISSLLPFLFFYPPFSLEALQLHPFSFFLVAAKTNEFGFLFMFHLFLTFDSLFLVLFVTFKIRWIYWKRYIFTLIPQTLSYYPFVWGSDNTKRQYPVTQNLTCMRTR